MLYNVVVVVGRTRLPSIPLAMLTMKKQLYGFSSSKPLFNQGNPFRKLKVYLLSIGALIKLIYN